jgi:hypothetical protein
MLIFKRVSGAEQQSFKHMPNKSLNIIAVNNCAFNFLVLFFVSKVVKTEKLLLLPLLLLQIWPESKAPLQLFLLSACSDKMQVASCLNWKGKLFVE